MGVYDAVLFDFDGVLSDSEPIHWEAWRDTLVPAGIVLDWQAYQNHCIGIADLKLLSYFASLAPRKIDSESLRSLYDVKRARFREILAQRDPIPKEVVSLIASLATRRLGVVTSSSRTEVTLSLERSGIQPFLRVLVCGEDVTNHKPYPEPYLLAAKKIGAKSPLVVEDSESGVLSARAAGFEVLRINGPWELKEALGKALT